MKNRILYTLHIYSSIRSGANDDRYLKRYLKLLPKLASCAD